jgi:hypothetical protein
VAARRSRFPHQLRVSTRDQGVAKNNITQQRVNTARVEWGSRRRTEADDRKDEKDDDNELTGAVCFSCHVCKTPVPKGYKLSTDKMKYEGLQEPEAWLDDYLQTITVQGGTKATSMQSLQLFFSGPARS